MNKKGVVLILTLWVLIILSLLAIGFAYRARIQSKLAAFSLREEKVLFLGEQGINRAIKEIDKDNNSFDAVSEDWYKPIIVEQKEGEIFAVVRDEESKININTASREVLEGLPGMDEEIAQEIIKQRPLDTENEVLDVEGITAEDYYGSKYKKGIRDLITVWGDGRININTACEEILELISGLSKETREKIISRQKNDPFTEIEDLKDIPGISLEEYSRLQDLTKVSSCIFKIFCKGSLSDAQRKIIAIVKKDKKMITILSWQEE